MIPAVILFNKKKIKGRTKKGLLIYKSISIIDNTIYYVPTKIISNENKYVLITPNILNKEYATLETVLYPDDNKKAEELALLYKYNLIHKKKYELSLLITDNKNSKQEDNNYYNIISIDPKGCKDIDDAFNIEYLDNKISKINIFIATLDDNLNTTFSPNYSTIYNIYNKNLSLFDDNITNNMSLIAGQTRKSIMITYDCNKIDNNISWSIQYIIVADNLDYDTALNTKYGVDINNLMIYFNIFDIHKLIEKLMLIVNNYMSKDGIINNVIYRNQNNNMSAEYSYNNLGHNTLNMSHYCHFTSPIRRYVDFINHYLLLNPSISFNINLNDINNKILNIKKYYRDMNIIKLYHIINDVYNGYYITKAKIIYIYNTKIDSDLYLLYLPEFDLKINYKNIDNIDLFNSFDYIEIACKKSNIITDKLLIKPKYL